MKRKGVHVNGKKEKQKYSFSDNGPKTLKCKKCGTIVEKCGHFAVAVTCAMCVQKMIDPPASMMKKSGTPKPKGWKFMKVFVDIEKNVYFRGVEQPDLKDTLEPTKAVPKERKKKLTPREKEKIEHEKNDLFAEIVILKKQLFAPSIPSKERKRAEKEIKSKEKQIAKLSKIK